MNNHLIFLPRPLGAMPGGHNFGASHQWQVDRVAPWVPVRLRMLPTGRKAENKIITPQRHSAPLGVFSRGEEKRYDMPIYKRCSRCGKRIPSGTTCPCQKQRHQEYDRYSRDKRSKDYYNSREWERARAAALDADGGLDVYLYMTTGEIVAADTAHHIIPLKDDWSKRADIDNLMSLHHDTHSTIEKKYKDNKAGMVRELAEMLRKYRRGQRGGAG